MLKGFRNSKVNESLRLPLSVSELGTLVSNIPKILVDKYMQVLLEAMLVFSFFLGLRLGEMTDSVHNLHISDIAVCNDTIKVNFKSFKHSKAPSTHLLKATNLFPCPYNTLMSYLRLRKPAPGPLFLLNNKAVSGRFFSKQFKLILESSGFNSNNYSPHSLRISAAKMWASKGLSDAQIRLLGRWQSNAFKNYLKGAVVHSE